MPVLAVFTLISCNSDSDDEDRRYVIAGDYLEDAIYFRLADEDQSTWFQSQIAKNSYLKVFQSKNGKGCSFCIFR